MNDKDAIQSLLKQAGIIINGPNPWDIQIHNEKFYRRLLSNTELAIGESYVDKWWDCEHLDQFIYRVLMADLETVALQSSAFWRSAFKKWWFDKKQLLFNHQTKRRALVVGKKHYDIGNDLYQIMLDKHMVYTCAYWDGSHTLDKAQEQKLNLVCQKLDLKPNMRVLDVGCGWGGFAKYAAERYGVSVVGITISTQQLDLGKKLCAGLPIELRFQDYRRTAKIGEKFDRVVSMGMFEHVGHKNYLTYMQAIDHCLKEDGLFLLHTIGTNHQEKTTNPWINAYIFPNSNIPTISRISSAFEGLFVMEDWQNLGIHYDKTLMAWYQNVEHGWDKLKDKYDEHFYRMWKYYLLSCAASFRARQNQLWQIVLSKKGLPEGYSYSKRILG
ncbi:MAG: cyclopropane-fatty-acyl-phospholipid synthase [Gammaproteobacteria bacterium 39-13]|nr:cyclopropane fatty acyl phospholipid synthase [Gammaproteobacteria bacterium]OJV93860.1 MAG: cyclopropane-fatty-acyl-phospholipid synthase [Gammaproteobacteria bacterium 39-13]